MQSQNRIFEDLSKVATSALGTLAGVTREIEAQARERARAFVAGEDAVSRDEFEAVKANAAAAREAVEQLQAEVAALRAALEAEAPAGATDAAPATSRRGKPRA